MVRTALEQRLNAAISNDDWVETLAQLFIAHGLVFGHGTDNASDEAFWLVRHLQRWQDAAWVAPPDPQLIPRVVELAERRIAERKPLAYLLGEAWFAGLRFNVDERVLVPRSPLAEIIERGFQPWCELQPHDRVLDIGTGSGCLAIAAAVHCPGVLVDATDVSAAALSVAAANVARHALESRVRLFEADLFPRSVERYRVIMSNPPYVPESELADLPPEYASEPVVALAGGATGLDPVDRILRGAREHLEPGGVLIMEVGGGAEVFARAYPELPVIWIEFEHGGDGVLVLAAEHLEKFARVS
ncbi:MAG TPA: 50S ribosomal protein L3 N(5)-glutamine methyltransferase [Gammaproteobacteria bacterium]|nr:50S ribosomal protein L3 N(5)-glutamine methyltransferase [Gammaproteobacteria bacterium]